MAQLKIMNIFSRSKIPYSNYWLALNLKISFCEFPTLRDSVKYKRHKYMANIFKYRLKALVGFKV